MNFASVVASVTVQAEQVRASSETLFRQPGELSQKVPSLRAMHAASMAKPPFQQHHFPHRGHLQPRLQLILTNGQLSLEPRGRWHSHGTSGGAALAKAEKKGCAPQQCSCPSSCSQLSLSQQLGMASLDTEGKGRQIPFVKLIPNILPYTHTLQRVSVRAQLIRARITPGMKW